jgi:hypothetical protein
MFIDKWCYLKSSLIEFLTGVIFSFFAMTYLQDVSVDFVLGFNQLLGLVVDDEARAGAVANDGNADDENRPDVRLDP